MASTRGRATFSTLATTTCWLSRRMTAIPTPRVSAMTSTVASVNRARRLRRRHQRRGRSAAIAGQPVSGAAYGLHRPAPERSVDLAAQIADVDLDHVDIPVVVSVPDMVEDLGLGDHLTAAPQQELQQGELARGQLDRDAAAGNLPGGGVEPQVAGCQHRRARR